MTKVAIIFHTGLGHTGKTAHAVAEGARGVEGVEVQVFEIKGEQIVEGRWSGDEVLNELSASDAIIFGAPTYMAGPSAQFKAFADATAGIWFGQAWKDKFAAGFSASGTPAGDKTITHHYFSALAAQHGMIWIGQSELSSQFFGSNEGINANGHYMGLGVIGGNDPKDDNPNEGDLKTARLFGARVAGIAARRSG